MKFEPNLESVRKHNVPKWFHDAKFGIFIHWGLYSVPAFAPVGKGSIHDILKSAGFQGLFRYHPCAEWYLNSLRISGSPTQKHHLATYGDDFKYDDFVPAFNQAIKEWKPEEWADLFFRSGARYVVLVTKHHDGFLLWPSKHQHPYKPGYHTSRDIVKELTATVKKFRMRMGLYYSSSLDWSFTKRPILDLPDLMTYGPISEEYVQYVNNHWRELINNYEPSILWSDIGYPPGTDLNELFAYFYNKILEGVVNDRWKQLSINERKLLQSGIGQRVLSWLAKRRFLKRRGSFPSPPHYDFLTLGAPIFKATKDKWESTQSIGMSFAYNQMEKLEDYVSYSDLVRLLVDIVSKNGNLLLSIGPRANGSIPTVQKNCLLGLGRWLEINGEAIFETRPWIKARSTTISNIEVRFTQKAEVLYAILLDTPKDLQITIKSLRIPPSASVRLLEYATALHWEQQKSNLVIYLPEELPDRPAHAFKINPVK